ncbi:MAG: DoxX family protein [Bacteroidia bacterium]|nr:DoxX family protein [Bacteroidia bacterium]NND26430.1 DoxX family protein [Flavobacteriaceae bacterium]MBT8279750.1 DoxX family protein [Bacteroidia bacterium]NNK59244.1 DoxX family protein [Flavobacteriaceae bacterium]NNL32922.1 DoxX family protein [Flavobacteriaceae bacterium]
MKIFLAIARLIVGSLFIVSGLIKCNDAIGFSYKLNDYFAHDVLNVEFLIPFSLALAVIICVVEIVLGIAVLFGLKSKLSTVLILLMMLFFTWLTWYTSSCLQDQEIAAKLGEEFSKNCVTDCGCFGDALKLEPIESFYKDLFLLIFTIPLFIFSLKNKITKNSKKEDLQYIVISTLLIVAFGVGVIKWWFTVIFAVILFAIVYLIKNRTKNDWYPLIATFIISLGFTIYCLQNLPIKDFRAYKIGSNIVENMSTPEDAPKPVIDYHWKFNVNGEEKIITTNGSYPTVDGELVGYETEIIEEGYEPSILDFSIETMEENFTERFLSEEKLIIIISYDLEKFNAKSIKTIKDFSESALKKGYTVIGLSASGEETKASFKTTNDLKFDWYLCDEKALKTVVRSNPGILELNKGTINQKVHWKNIDDLILN